MHICKMAQAEAVLPAGYHGLKINNMCFLRLFISRMLCIQKIKLKKIFSMPVNNTIHTL